MGVWVSISAFMIRAIAWGLLQAPNQKIRAASKELGWTLEAQAWGINFVIQDLRAEADRIEREAAFDEALGTG